MVDYVTLLGAETVEKAARAMERAATSFGGHVGQLEWMLNRLVEVLDRHSDAMNQMVEQQVQQQATQHLSDPVPGMIRAEQKEVELATGLPIDPGQGPELALVAIRGDHQLVLEASGPLLERALAGSGAPDMLFNAVSGVPSEGLWVWEGTPREEDDLLQLHAGRWRPPTADEWQLIIGGFNCWVSRRQGAYDPVGGGGGTGRSDLPYGQGGGGD